MTNIPLYTCSTCSHKYPASASSCPSCGTEISTVICPHCRQSVMWNDTCYCNGKAPYYENFQWRATPYEEYVPTLYEDPYSTLYDTPFETPYDVVPAQETEYETPFETPFDTDYDTDYDTNYSISSQSYDLASNVPDEIDWDDSWEFEITAAGQLLAQDSATDIAPMSMLEDDTNYIEEDFTPYEDINGPEKETEYCPCDETAGSSQSNMACVDFSISFGRFPSFPEIPAGKLTLYATMLDRKLGEPDTLNYEHIIQRSVNSIKKNNDYSYTIGGASEKMYPRFYHLNPNEFECKPMGMSQCKPERMRFYDPLNNVTVNNLDNSNFVIHEVLANGTQLFYPTRGYTFNWYKMITPNRINISKNDIEEEIKIIRYSEYFKKYSSNGQIPLADGVIAGQRDNGDRLVQIWNKTDGLLYISNCHYETINKDKFTSYSISWYAPEDVLRQEQNNLFSLLPGASPIKSWIIKGEAVGGNLLYNVPEDQRKECIHSFMGEFKYLSQLTITENRGDKSFHSRWEQLSFDKLLFTRGMGDTAEQCLKIRTALKYASAYNPGNCEAIRNADGSSLMIGNSSVIEFKTEKIYYMGDKSIQYLCTVKSPVPQKYEVEITKRFEFGDCLLYRASGSLTPLNGSPVGLDASNFIYYTDKSSPDYGLLKEEVKTNGLTIHNQYDYKGRLSIRTETCNNFKKITHNTYCNVEFNDRRIARTREFLEINGLRRYMAETQYIYENTPAVIRHTVKRRTELNREPDVSFTEWYGWDSNSNGSYSPFAIGRLKCERNADGKETFYRYNTSSEDGIAYTCYQTERYKGLPFPHSKQTVLSYNMRGEIAKKQEYIHL